MKILLVYNKYSGKGLKEGKLEKIVESLKEKFDEVVCHVTEEAGDITEYIKANGSDFDNILALGGDGSIHEAINGVMFLEKKPINVISYIIIALMTSVLLFECFYFKSIYEFDDSRISLLLIRIIGSVCAILVCTFLANLLCKFKTQRIISKCGAFTLESFYIHLLFLRHMKFSTGNGFIYYFQSFGVSLLLLAIVAFITIVMYFVPYFHLLIFGKSFSRYEFEKKLPKVFH